MEIAGKIIAVLDIQSGTSSKGNNWQKRDFVLETHEQYPKKVAFTLFGDKVSLCPTVGEECTVHFDIDANEYKGRWYNQINAWKVDRPSAQQTQTQTQAAPQTQSASSADDLPF